MNLPNITDVPLSQLPQIVTGLGIKRYAADQIVSWLYKKKVSSFDEMTNLSIKAREILNTSYSIEKNEIEKIVEAPDKTKKFLFAFSDGSRVESVLIPAMDDRLTICVSTEVGCAMGCGFCRTSHMGFKRDLTQGEILSQLIDVQRLCDKDKEIITNIVFMGMGEPLVNYDSVLGAIQIILSERAFNFSKRRVTLSTSGLVPQLEKLMTDIDIRLAISLNATTNSVRNKLMPINKRYPIESIMEFAQKYTKKTKNAITFEYVVIKDINDTDKDMERLVKLMKGIRAKINLIPFNPFSGSEYKSPSEKTILEFHKYLTDRHIQTNIRISRGQGIMAACGQLAA
ncbi:MAG: 23S rRNA (adenine(2503)-C(2))-methyltransferase RlmN [Deltaproteobacteria bacterium CG07_land_8_20_14_0_80_38_7]|nr:MAG: 23S rRNA (adenine(2503)-C(2))-methyltransferase RlmN [Deltaproteobacteria bacterium CG07_land_8_20_14_0_80_38_7]